MEDYNNSNEGVNQTQYISSAPEQKSNKKIWLLILIPIFIILIGVVIFLFMGSSSKTISDNEFSQGTNFQLKQNNEAKFIIDDEEHTIKVDSVSDDSVTLTIQSNPLQVNLKIGDERKVDLNDDGIYDIQVKLNSIENGVPEIYIKKIHESSGQAPNAGNSIIEDEESSCTENWSCGEWSSCSEQGSQTRTCTDLNSCGTTNNKPSTSQRCTYVEDCTEDWDCSEWGRTCIRGSVTRTCTDKNLCNTYENKPIESKDCSHLCSETDGGRNYLEKGSATSTQLNFEGTVHDYCGGSGPGILREFYCNETYGTYFDDNFDCSTLGKYCFDGACRDAEEICCEINGDNYELLKFSEYNFCSQLGGVEVAMALCSSSDSYCFDLDDSTEERAQSGDHSTDFIKSYVIRDKKVSEDTCVTPTTVSDAACDTSWGYWSMPDNCPNGCLDGACIS